MLKIDNFIISDKDIFYADVEAYNEQADVKIGDGDMVKFTFENCKYIGTIVNRGGAKNGIYQFEKIKKLS